jgi:hypothetical protein
MRGHFWVYYPSYGIKHYFNKVSRRLTIYLFMLSCFNVVVKTTCIYSYKVFSP